MTDSSQDLDNKFDKIIHDKILDELSHDIPTFRERITDFVADFGGSWRFIISFTIIFLAWIAFNQLIYAFDAYPFMALNLAVSLLSIYQAPFILMSQNRMSDIDRKRELRAYEIAIKAEMEIKELHQKIDNIIDFYKKTKS